MHYVMIRPSIAIPNSNPPKMFSFMEVLRDLWLNHQEQFGKGATAVRIVVKLDKLFSKYKEGDYVPVEDADYAKLRIATETTDYNPSVARHLLPFVDSVLEAPTEDPSKKAEKAEDSTESPPQTGAVS